MKMFITAITISALFLCPASIEAKKKVKVPAVPQMQNYPSTTISDYRLRGGVAVLRSRINLSDNQQNLPETKESIKQFSQALTSSGTTIYIRNYIINQETVRTVSLDEDHNIDMKIDIPYPMFVDVVPLGQIYLCPDDTAYINIDPTKHDWNDKFSFDGTGLSGEVNRLMNKIQPKYLSNFSNYRITNPSQIDSLMMWRDEQVALMDNMVTKMNEGLPELAECSPLASDIVRTRILTLHMFQIMDSYNDRLEGDYDKDAFWRNYYDFLAPREKYLLDNPLLMIAGDHFFFDRMEFEVLEPLMPKATESYPRYYTHGHFSDTENTLSTYGKNLSNGMLKIGEQLHINPNGFSSQVCFMNFVFYVIEKLKSFQVDQERVADLVAYMMPYITDPALARIATLTYRDHIKQYEAQVTEDKLLTKGDSIFHRIIEPYKGNVLQVDFWNMACGPCRGRMLKEREEVEAMKDKPVKFLYVTNDNPEKCNQWMNENNIKGEHIFITPKEWSYLQEKFNFSAIPFGVLIDKTGKVRKEWGKTYTDLLEE